MLRENDENGFTNDSFCTEEGDDTMTILYLGLKRAGKTTIKERVFDQLPENGIIYVAATSDIKVSYIQSFKKVKIVDIPGSRNFVAEIERTMWHLPVEKGGLDIGGPTANLAAIYVIDTQDNQFYSEAIERMSLYAAELRQYNSKVKFEVFLNKADLLNEDQNLAVLEETYSHVDAKREDDESGFMIPLYQTTVYDHSIFDSTSRVIQKLIKEQAQLENLLNLMIHKAFVDKAYLFDVRTKLYVATDSIQPSELTMLEICSGMIEMVVGISNYYENRGDEAEDVVTVFDENTESWVSMNNQILTCLFGITPELALVCVMRDDVEKCRGPYQHNLLKFRAAVRQMLGFKC